MAEDDEGGKGENRARSDRLASRGDGLDDVIFEDGGVAEKAQERHRDDGRRDTGGNGHAGIEAEIGVGCAKNQGEERAEDKGAERQLAKFGGWKRGGVIGLRRRHGVIYGIAGRRERGLGEGNGNGVSNIFRPNARSDSSLTHLADSFAR